MPLQEPASTALYHAVSLRLLPPFGRGFGPGLLLLAWLATLVLSIALGLATINYEWSGLALHLGGVDIHLTLYPPLIFCTLWVLWFGFWWGFVPAYLATLVLALYSGMPLAWSLLFAFADPLSLAVLAIAYRAIPIRYDLRSPNALAFFVLISFVGSLFGATGSFIWTHTNTLGVDELLPIWQGWWLGGWLQTLLLVAPLLYLFSPIIGRWREHHFPPEKNQQRDTRGTLLAMTIIIIGVLSYLYFTVRFSQARLDAALLDTDSSAWREAALAHAETTELLFWVVAILIGFISFFGAQLFIQWTRSLQQTARELSGANVSLRREITRREQIEQDLQISAARLGAANASKDRLFSIVAHDLRGPVSAIVSLLGLLDQQIRQLGNAELNKHFSALREAMQQLMRFLENLLQWSHLQLKQDQFHPQTIALAKAVDEAFGLSALHASLKAISLEQHIPPSLQVHADPQMLQTILHNLLGNGIKFTNSLGTVSVAATPHPQGVAISVRDTGTGIDTASLSRLFNIAQIESRPGTNGEAGNGMGLLLCKELVERHGGQLWLESQPGQGTEVHFTLPSTNTP